MGAPALEPTLTKFDRRVLEALDRGEYDDGCFKPAVYRNAWQVAERVGEYDAGLVRDTLRGLAHLGYAYSRNFDKRQAWARSGMEAER